MKIYGKGIYQNEVADTIGIGYAEFTISELEKSIEFLKDTNEICQDVLGLLDMLIVIEEKFPSDVSSRLKRSKVLEWEAIFNEWFERVRSKIPSKYRDAIQSDAKKLFDKIANEYSHTLEWL